MLGLRSDVFTVGDDVGKQRESIGSYSSSVTFFSESRERERAFSSTSASDSRLQENDALLESVFCPRTVSEGEWKLSVFLSVFEDVSLLWESVISCSPIHSSSDVLSLLFFLDSSLCRLDSMSSVSDVKETNAVLTEELEQRVAQVMGQLFSVLLNSFEGRLVELQLWEVAKVSCTRFALFCRVFQLLPCNQVMALL